MYYLMIIIGEQGGLCNSITYWQRYNLLGVIMWINLLNKEQYRKATDKQKKICDDYNKRMYFCCIGLLFVALLIISDLI